MRGRRFQPLLLVSPLVDNSNKWFCMLMGREVAKNDSRLKSRWRDTCMKLHQGWQYMWWDRESIRAFLDENYPWFLDTFDKYPKLVLQGQTFSSQKSLMLALETLPCMCCLPRVHTTCIPAWLPSLHAWCRAIRVSMVTIWCKSSDRQLMHNAQCLSTLCPY